MTPAQRLEAVGRLLYGQRWKRPTAALLGIDQRQIRRWATGESELAADHGLFADLREKVAGIRASLADAEKILRCP